MKKRSIAESSLNIKGTPNWNAETIAYYIIEKLISMTVTTNFNKEIEKQIPGKCWDFMRGLMDNFVKLEHIAIDRDDLYLDTNASNDKKNLLNNYYNSVPHPKLSMIKRNSDIRPSKQRPSDLMFYRNELIAGNTGNTAGFNSLDSLDKSDSNNMNDNTGNTQENINNQKDLMNNYETNTDNNGFPQISVNIKEIKALTLESNNTMNIIDNNYTISETRNRPIYYNNKLTVVNDWSFIEEPTSCKIDRAASSVIKVIKGKDQITNNLHIKEEGAIDTEAKTIPRPGTTNTITSPNRENIHTSKSKLTDKNDKNDKLDKLDKLNITPYEQESITNNEEDEHEAKEIEELRKFKKEEWKKKEEEVKVKQRNEKETQEKALETVKKQREYERKNVTTDSYGNIIFIKALASEKMSNDFINPKSDIKNKGEITNLPTASKSEGASTKEKVIKRETVKKENSTISKKVDISTPYGNATLDYQRPPVTPAGSSFNLIMPEVGVTIMEGGQSKYGGGGREFHKAFKKYSKYDYQSFLKDFSNTYYTATLKDIDNTQSDNELPDKKDSLPSIGYHTRTEGMGNNPINSKYNSAFKVHTKMGSLKSTLDGLDQIVEYEEHMDQETNNKNYFKETKSKKESDNEKYVRSLEEINKFNLSIVKNTQWGSNYNPKPHSEKFENKTHYKPNLKEIEKEVGKNIVKTKLPRSRVYSFIKTANGTGSQINTLNPMNSTVGNGTMKNNKMLKTFGEGEKLFNKTRK